MHDITIRRELKTRLAAQHQDTGTLVIDELGICRGEARVDVALINGTFSAFEIKSAVDTLRRLTTQVASYGRVFDYVTAVVATKHLAKLQNFIPEWWGILEAKASGNSVRLSHKRRPKRNRSLDPYALVQMLWRREAVALLRESGFATHPDALPMTEIWEIVSVEVPPRVIAAHVRGAIKGRSRWRSDLQQTRCDGYAPIGPTAEHRQKNLDWLLSLPSPNRPR